MSVSKRVLNIWLQVLLISYLEGIEYEELTLDSGSALLPDTSFSPAGDYIYVLTTSKVRMTSVAPIKYLLKIKFKFYKFCSVGMKYHLQRIFN